MARYPPAIHNLSTETRYEIMDGNVLRKLLEEDEVWKEVIKWIVDGKVPKMKEVRGGIQEVISGRQIFNPTLFVMGSCVITVIGIQPSHMMLYVFVHQQ